MSLFMHGRLCVCFARCTEVAMMWLCGPCLDIALYGVHVC